MFLTITNIKSTPKIYFLTASDQLARMNLDLIIEEFFFYLDYFNMTDLRSLVSPPPLQSGV